MRLKGCECVGGEYNLFNVLCVFIVEEATGNISFDSLLKELIKEFFMDPCGEEFR